MKKQNEAPSTVESDVPWETETRPGILGPFWSHSEPCEVLLRESWTESATIPITSVIKCHQVEDAVKCKRVIPEHLGPRWTK